MANETLTTTGPTRPGVYIGKLYRNQAGAAPGFRRYPGIVAKGSRYKLALNQPIRRAFRERVPLTFANVSPHTATLSYNAVNDQLIPNVRLYKSDNTPVPPSRWQFVESVTGSGNFDTVLMLPDVYDSSATYYLDYQSSDRTLLDALLVSDLRQVTVVGDTENQDRYTEYRDFFVPVDVTEPDPATANANSLTTDHAWSAVSLGGQTNTINPIANGPTIGTWDNTSNPNTGTLTPANVTLPGPVLNHNYNRTYRLVFASNVSPYTVYLIAEQNSGGNESRANVPVHPDIDNANYPITMMSTATQALFNNLSFVDPEIGETINVDVDLTGPVPQLGDSFLFTHLGHSFIEVDQSLTNAQWPVLSAVTPGTGNAGTGTVTIRSDAEYDDVVNRTYRLVCTAVAGVTPNRTASFVWAGWGEMPVVTGTANINEATATNTLVELHQGVRLSFAFGGANFSVGDTFEFSADAARRYITAKDSRNYNLEVTATSAGAVQVLYSTDTFEGSFGTTSVTGPVGELALPGDIRLWVRNIGATVAQNRYVTADTWTWTTTDEQVMDWSLTQRTEETIPVSKVYTDNLGLATGVVGAQYVVLSNVPTTLRYVRDSVTGTLITGSVVVSGKPILRLLVTPSNPIEVGYEYIGLEPTVGAYYYVSMQVLRPVGDYNTPKFFTNYEDEAAVFLGPSSVDNHALIAAQIALVDNGAPGIYVTQVYDADQDGQYTDTDYVNAIDKQLSVTKNTDLLVLGRASTLARQMLVNENGNDPFKNRVNLALWASMPSGSVIGSVDVPGSIVFTAKKTLQLPFTSQARGTRILTANYDARKTITLSDNSQVSVDLDGSFIALAVAARNASFSDPNTLLLNQVIGGFDYINTFTEDEILTLIDASTLIIYNDGSEDVPVYKVVEGVTVDASEDSLHEINVMNVRTFTTADMKEHLVRTAIGYVPDSQADAVSWWRSQIVLRLNYWRNSLGVIGQWEDEQGNVRELDPNADVQVYRSKQSKTQIFFKYFWFGRYGTTRGFGVYGVDIANPGQPV